MAAERDRAAEIAGACRCAMQVWDLDHDAKLEAQVRDAAGRH